MKNIVEKMIPADINNTVIIELQNLHFCKTWTEFVELKETILNHIKTVPSIDNFERFFRVLSIEALLIFCKYSILLMILHPEKIRIDSLNILKKSFKFYIFSL